MLNHRFISLVPPCYIVPRELYPLPKTKCVVPTQISILFQWQSLLQLSLNIYAQSLRSKFRKHLNTLIALLEKPVTHIVSRIIRLFGQFEPTKMENFVFLNGM
jgi:hypothetical protein